MCKYILKTIEFIAIIEFYKFINSMVFKKYLHIGKNQINPPYSFWYIVQYVLDNEYQNAYTTAPFLAGKETYDHCIQNITDNLTSKIN